MPRVNLYLNKEDYLKWVEIPNKSLFVAEAINEAMPKSFKEPITEEVVKKIFEPTKSKSCKHGFIPAFCKYMECRK
jgi:hypothetical protein